MSASTCCVPNCNKTRKENVILHLFPKPDLHPELFRDWLFAIGGDILALDNGYIFRNRRVCHIHFEERFHTRSKMLTANAVPTLHLPGLIRERRAPLSDITNENVEISNQHIYTAGATVDSQQHPAKSTEVIETEQPTTSHFRGTGTHKKRKLLDEKTTTMVQKIKKMELENKKFKYRLKQAMNLETNATFLKSLKNFTTMATIFTFLQFRESSKKKMGRRFTKDEKVMSIALYKRSPKQYRWLRKIFVLPAPSTLSRMIRRADLKAGINENIFAQLKKNAKNMKSDHKLCALLFDEMSLMPHLDYNRRRDTIVGFVDDGQQKLQKIADHALVFMIRGVVKNYKQPIAYSFCSGSTPTLSLANQITKIIERLYSIGFTVICTVCDQGTTNVSAINHLIEQTRREKLRRGEELRHDIFEIAGRAIIPLFDPPHLIKGIRINMLQKDLIFKSSDGNEKVAKWEHIIKLYEENMAFMGLRILPKLTENHVYCEKIPKMKVKYATQVYSYTVATTMGYLADKGVLPADCRDTAEILLFFDELFDSVNGSHDNFLKRKGKPLLGVARGSRNSHHQNMWVKSKQMLKSMKFVSKSGQIGSVPTIKNWLRTIDNLQYMLYILSEEYKVTSVWLRHFNQDPLENFFGGIRSHGGRNTFPTCAQFEAAFASLLVTNLSSSSPGSNCEEDTCKMFQSIKKIFFVKEQSIVINRTINIHADHINENFTDYDEKIKNVKVKAELQYVTGYILRQLKKHIFKNCSKCTANFYTQENSASSFIKIRERVSGKTSLAYPSNDLIKCFSNMQDTIINIINSDCAIKDLKNYIKLILCTIIDYNFIQCEQHKKQNIEFMQDLTCRFFICNFCRDTNKLLSGKRTDFDRNNEIQRLANAYHVKRKK